MKSPNGFPVLSPYLAVANQSIKQMIRMVVEFGMSPASRTGIETLPPPETDEEREFFGPREL